MNEKTDVGKNNYWSMIVEGGFYFAGYTFFDAYVIIPVFVDALTGNLKLAGLAVALKLSLFIIPQLLMGLYTARIKNVPMFLGITGFSGRAAFFAVPLILLTNANPYIKVSILYFALAAASFADGLTNVPWLDILGRTIEPAKRGRLMGYQMLLGGVGGLGAGLLIKRMLAGNGTIESKYASVFLIGAIVITISGLLLFTLKDSRGNVTVACEPHILKYLKGLRRFLLDNQDYRKLIATQVLANFSGLAAPLYVLFAKSHFSLDAKKVTTLIFVQIMGGLFSGIAWGNLSHRKGNRFTIQASLIGNAFLAALAMFLYLYGAKNAMAPLTIMVFIAGILQGGWLGYTNYLLDIVPDKERPAYIALTSTILFPFTLIPFIGGVIADTAGFPAVFLAVEAFVLLALSMSFGLKEKHSN